MVFQQKIAHSNLPSIGRFYANETPLTDDFYCHKTLDFSRRAAGAHFSDKRARARSLRLDNFKH